MLTCRVIDLDVLKQSQGVLLHLNPPLNTPTFTRASYKCCVLDFLGEERGPPVSRSCSAENVEYASYTLNTHAC